MAGALDAIMKSVAGSLIDTFGTTATLTTPGYDVFNPLTGEIVEGVETTVPIKCSPPDAYGINEIDGTRILRGDMRIIIPTSNYAEEPKTSQKITIRDREYQIISVMPYSSGNSEAAWEVQLRA